MIECKKLNFGYGHSGQKLYQGLELRLERPGVTGLLGFNGAGKTTLLHLLSGLRFPTSGQCLLDGQEPSHRHAALLEKTVFVPESVNLPDLRPDRWLQDRAPFYPGFDYDLFEILMEEFGIAPDVRLSSLSLGSGKKVVLAFALATRARFMLLDEPTNGLDIPGKAALRKMWARYLPEDTFLMVSTHQVRELGNQLDYLLILDNGQLVVNISISELEERFSFSRHTGLPLPGAIYGEPVVGGYHCLYPAGHPATPGEPDLELFCKAVFDNTSFLNL